MNIVQITPGAGGMYCGNCFRDNALVADLRKLGHETLMVPLYLPMTLDEEDQSKGSPIFFSGISVYLEQKFPAFAKAPHWLHNLLAAPALLKWAGGKAAKTRAADLGDLTLSMLRGEEGNQARELEVLISWLKGNHKPGVVCLSNVLLAGMARRLRGELGAPVVCMLQGEDSFLDSLPESHRKQTWELISRRAAEIDLFIAPSRYFGDLMAARLNLPPEKIKVVYNGIDLKGYQPPAQPPNPPVIGFFARMCREKGLDTLVEAFLALKARGSVPNLKLHIGGGMGPSDEPLVAEIKNKLQNKGLLGDVEFFPNVDHAAKLRFFEKLSVLSVPALYGEAFGLYVVEAFAAGVPVVQPDHAAFPELIAASKAGVLYSPKNAINLADALETLLLDPARLASFRAAGREAALRQFNAPAMAANMLEAFRAVPSLARQLQPASV